MKNYEEMAKLVLEARDEYVKKKKNRVLFLKRASVVTFGAAAVLGIGIFTHVMKPPKKPTPSQSGIIVETETTSAETTAAQTSPSTTAPKTTATNQTTTTFVSTTVTTSSTQQTVTTVHTTTVAARTTRTAVNTTAAVTTSVTVQTTAAMTTTDCIATNEISTGSTEHIPWKRVYYGDNNTIYRFCSNDSGTITASADYVGEYYGDATLAIDSERQPCQMYTYKNFSPQYVCAVKEADDDEFVLYTAWPNFESLGEFLDGTDIEHTLVLKYAYHGFGENNEEPIGVPVVDDLMEALSERSIESQKDSVLHGSASYMIYAEIPEFGEFGTITLLKTKTDGYISFSILGNKCVFNVGVDKLDGFISSFT